MICGAAATAYRNPAADSKYFNGCQGGQQDLQFPKKYVIILKKDICIMHMLDFYEKLLYNKKGYNI